MRRRGASFPLRFASRCVLATPSAFSRGPFRGWVSGRNAAPPTGDSAVCICNYVVQCSFPIYSVYILVIMLLRSLLVVAVSA